MTDTDTHINVRLFIARIITNRPKVRHCCHDSLCADIYMLGVPTICYILVTSISTTGIR